MAMDGLALYAVTQELQPLVGGKIDKIQQPEKDMLLFSIRAGGETRRLLICSHAENGRAQLTQKSYENPENAPAFCMLLRRRLVGARITAIRQEAGLERVLHIELLARDELRDSQRLRLSAELLGKHANLFLLGADGTIIDCTHRVSAGETSTRILLPGFPYPPVPPQDKRALFDADADALAAALRENDPGRALSAAFSGLSRQSANALATACPSPAALAARLEELRNGGFAPSLSELGVLPFLPAASHTPFLSMSEAYDAYFAARDRLVRMQRHSSALRRATEQALKRARNRQSVYFDALQNEAAGERGRLSGEWILANLHRIRPGDSQIVVDNYYTDPSARETVPLDPRLSPNENAQRYFKQYKKSKTARAYAQRQMAAVSAEIDYLEGQLQNISNADRIAELDEIRDELIRERYLKPDRQAAKKRLPAAVSEPLSFRSSDGVLIRVGKNNRQNDALTLKTARPDNLFLHAKNIPGSHVIIDFSGEPPERTLHEAAMLAAYFSAARASASVPVDYTERRHVKKPAGARPGFVIYAANRTLYVTPDAALVESLKT
ncbi:MAG: NFACT family protein [Clostridia bacterium]|nr:NFACT family protein [Clostridia bacterium]